MKPSLFRQLPPAMMASHTAWIEVNGVVEPVGFQIPPGYPIRLGSSGLDIVSRAAATFVVNNSAGVAVFGPQDATPNFNGNAWIDTTSPVIEDTYTLLVAGFSSPFQLFTHDASTTFVVSKTAPPPPTGGRGDGIFSNIKTILIIIAVIAGIVYVVPIVSRVVPQRGANV